MSTEIFIGRIKWFNNKTGYGFITVTDGKRSGNDIFVHHSAINVEGQYKYLVQGEYIEFSIVDTPSGKHECQASNVNGIKGGKLMCTTRHETNIARSNYKKDSTDEPRNTTVAEPTTVAKPRQERPPRKSIEKKDDGEWVQVSSKSKDSSVKKPRGRPAAPKTTTPKKEESK
jgi:CspA family cold shock protein